MFLPSAPKTEVIPIFFPINPGIGLLINCLLILYKFPPIFAGCKYTTNFSIYKHLISKIFIYLCIVIRLEMLEFLHFSWIDIVDILMVAAIIYMVFRWIRGSTAINIFIAIIIVIVIRVIAEALGMKMISSLLGTLIDMGAVALVVIFQPEVRRFLSTVGRTAGHTLEQRTFLQRLFPGMQARRVDTRILQEITEACREMSAQKTGALIVIQHKNPLDEIIATGDTVDAEVGRRLIMNIFFKNSPLHDGAMVIGGNRIVAARCTLPITDRTDLPARYGMRHKAAIGISEQCDADVIVVSEETGGISFVRGGKITSVDTINTLNLLLGEKTE